MLNAVEVVYVFIKNVKTIVLNVLPVNVYANIKNERVDVQNVMEVKYVNMVIINTVA